jgi:hypothetical protein
VVVRVLRIRKFRRCEVNITVWRTFVRCMAPLMLGGQNGEEGKVEDEVSCEEDRAQDREAQVEEEVEVTRRRCGRLRVLEGSLALNGVAERARNAPATTRRTRFDDGGRRRNRRSLSQVPHSNRLASRCLPSQVPCRSTAHMAGTKPTMRRKHPVNGYGNCRTAPLAGFTSAVGTGLRVSRRRPR